MLIITGVFKTKQIIEIIKKMKLIIRSILDCCFVTSDINSGSCISIGKLKNTTIKINKSFIKNLAILFCDFLKNAKKRLLKNCYKKKYHWSGMCLDFLILIIELTQSYDL